MWNRQIDETRDYDEDQILHQLPTRSAAAKDWAQESVVPPSINMLLTLLTLPLVDNELVQICAMNFN